MVRNEGRIQPGAKRLALGAPVSVLVRHRDHDPTNNDGANLAALCQRCHILHDKLEHLRRRRLTYLARRALGDLFTGPYG